MAFVQLQGVACMIVLVLLHPPALTRLYVGEPSPSRLVLHHVEATSLAVRLCSARGTVA